MNKHDEATDFLLAIKKELQRVAPFEGCPSGSGLSCKHTLCAIRRAAWKVDHLRFPTIYDTDKQEEAYRRRNDGA